MYPFKKIAHKSFDKWFNTLVWSADNSFVGIMVFILVILITPIWLIPTLLMWVLSGIDSVLSKFINIDSSEKPLLAIPQLLVMLTYGLPMVIRGFILERRDSKRNRPRRPQGGYIAAPLPPIRMGRPLISPHGVPIKETKITRQRREYNNGKPLKFKMK